jgi:uncharacterized protein (DUF2141 family)
LTFDLKKITFISGFSAFLAVLGLGLRPAQGEGLPSGSVVELEIAVGTGRGRVLCAVYERSGWLKRPVKGSASSIHGRTATCRFTDLKPGTYAAGAFQDENLNGRLDRKWTGLPAEPWCVSREIRGTLGPPSFEAASFAVREPTVRVHCRAR